MSQATLKSVNAAIRRLGGAEQLVRGDGYHYFIGGVAEELADFPSIYVCRTNQLSLDQWIEEWRSMKSDAETRLQEKAENLDELPPGTSVRIKLKIKSPGA